MRTLHQFIGCDESRQGLTGRALRHLRMAHERQIHRPQQIGDHVRDPWLRIHHGDVHIAGRRPNAIGTYQIDFHFRYRGAKVAQYRYGQQRGEARRHLHPQGAQTPGRIVANIVERIFEPVKGLGDGGQQQLSRLGQDQAMWLALEQLRSNEFLERDHMPRQGALRNQQRIGGGGETQMFGDPFERREARSRAASGGRWAGSWQAYARKPTARC